VAIPAAVDRHEPALRFEDLPSLAEEAERGVVREVMQDTEGDGDVKVVRHDRGNVADPGAEEFAPVTELSPSCLDVPVADVEAHVADGREEVEEVTRPAADIEDGIADGRADVPPDELLARSRGPDQSGKN
jgi:hypothetical protein